MIDAVEGQRLVAACEFRVMGSPVDPTLVRCYVRHPSGVVDTLVYPSAQVVRLDVGLYEAWITPDAPGTWGVSWEGAGSIDAYDAVLFNVSADPVRTS